MLRFFAQGQRVRKSPPPLPSKLSLSVMTLNGLKVTNAAPKSIRRRAFFNTRGNLNGRKTSSWAASELQFNFELLDKHPKLFIGFSDLTALQWCLFKMCDVPSLTGFTITTQFNSRNLFLDIGLAILSGKRNSILHEDVADTPVRTIEAGEAEGLLLGGTLSMICSLCGTPYFVNRNELILFIEDVNEPLYRIDRCFQQLSLIGFWQKVNAVILGQFLNEDKLVDVVPLLQPHLKKGIPLIADFPYCHQTNCMLLPQGVFARLVTSPFMLTWEPFIF